MTQKGFKIPYRYMLTQMIVYLPVGILIFVFFNTLPISKKNDAIQGQIDFNEGDFNEKKYLQLNGEWEFYWNRLYQPIDFERATIPYRDGFIKVPGIWNGFKINDENIGGKGCATLRLKIKNLPVHELLAFKSGTFSNAYNLWINDDLVASNGIVADNAAYYKPEYKPLVSTFKVDTSEANLTVQIANFHHWKGGFWHPLTIGTFEKIQKINQRQIMQEMFLFGCLFMMALYHFGLFVLRRSDKGTLFFGLICLTICTRSLFTGENIIQIFAPNLDWFIARKIEYILTFLTVPIYMAFIKTIFPEEINNKLYKIFMGFGLLLCLFVPFAPIEIYSFSSYIFSGFTWIASAYGVIIFYKATKKQKEGAKLFLSTSIFFIFTIINDVLNQTEIIHSGLYLPFGLLIVVFAQSYILSSRSALAFRNSEIYARTFQKFVPAQFLKRIAKDGIESIRPGNAEKAELTVMFSDIRSFTELAESINEEEVFKMLNKYLSYVEPPIRKYDGFVDKYMGDGIMALFEKGESGSSAQNAVLAALEMQKALEEYNSKRKSDSKPELKAGIGIHSGELIIGIMGGEERMDSTAIGDAVNLASRIEGLTKTYGVTILMSESTVHLLQNPNLFYLRFIDDVLPKGKKELVGIWEVMGLKNDDSLKNLETFLTIYQEGLDLFKNNRKKEAASKFQQCVDIQANDSVSKIYLARCLE